MLNLADILNFHALCLHFRNYLYASIALWVAVLSKLEFNLIGKKKKKSYIGNGSKDSASHWLPLKPTQKATIKWKKILRPSIFSQHKASKQQRDFWDNSPAWHRVVFLAGFRVSDKDLIALLDAVISLSSNAWQVILSLQWTSVMLIFVEPGSALPHEHVST